MGTRQGRLRDAHDVIVDPLHTLIFQGVNGRGVVNCSHDHRGREPSHVFFPLFWTFEDSASKNDGLRHLYIVERLGSRFVQAFMSRSAHASPSTNLDQRGLRLCNTPRRGSSQHPILEEADFHPTC